MRGNRGGHLLAGQSLRGGMSLSVGLQEGPNAIKKMDICILKGGLEDSTFQARITACTKALGFLLGGGKWPARMLTQEGRWG